MSVNRQRKFEFHIKKTGRQTLVLCKWPCIVIVNRKALYMDIGMPKEYITLKALLKWLCGDSVSCSFVMEKLTSTGRSPKKSPWTA